jgi:hypothetical protein
MVRDDSTRCDRPTAARSASGSDDHREGTRGGRGRRLAYLVARRQDDAILHERLVEAGAQRVVLLLQCVEPRLLLGRDEAQVRILFLQRPGCLGKRFA